MSQLTQDHSFVERYIWISNLIAQAYKAYRDLFQKRHDAHHIKRCHGDLKTTNLWIEPEKTFLFGLKKYPRQLLALDCVDFNPEFCHIDTLSDVAMLAIDLEMHLSDWLKMSSNRQEGEALTRYFLKCYLGEMKEDSEENSRVLWSLLEYYMTEKSMVCAYVSILYDERPVIGKKYLEVALAHAQRLEKMLNDLGCSPTLERLSTAVC